MEQRENSKAQFHKNKSGPHSVLSDSYVHKKTSKIETNWKNVECVPGDYPSGISVASIFNQIPNSLSQHYKIPNT
jgi:hypothetical protein